MYYYRYCMNLLVGLLCFFFSADAFALIISSYFPAHEGNFWNFSEEGKSSLSTWAINGNFNLRQVGNVFILLQDDGRFFCLKEDWEGLQIYGEFTPGTIYVPDQPILFFPRDINPDPNVSLAVTANFKIFSTVNPQNPEEFEFKQTGTEVRHIAFRMKGYDAMQDGSRKFEDCIVLEKTTRIGQSQETLETIWFAPTVGPVKRVVERGGKKVTHTIVSYAGAGSDQTQHFATKDYFPLKPGLRWTYQDQRGGTRITETKLQEKANYKDIMVTPYEDYLRDVHFFAFNESGLVLQQKYWSMYGGCQAPVPPEEPPVVLPAELKPGEFHRSYSNMLSHRWPSMQLSPFSHMEFVFSSVPVAIENVTTPAGTFNNCIKVCLFYIAKVNLMQLDLARIGYIWLSKDTGIVREEVLNLANFALPERVNSVYDIRFWQLAKFEAVNASKVLSLSETIAMEPAPATPPPGAAQKKTLKAITWENLVWENNSKAMFDKIVEMMPFFIRPLGKIRVMDSIKAKAGAAKNVTENMVIESIKESSNGMPIKDIVKALEAMQTV